MFNRPRKGTLVRQHDITDCGAACLASISAYYNLQIPIAQIRLFAYTNQRGTNVLGLVDAAKRLGFQCKGVKGSKESLLKIPKPSIAHVIIKEHLHHFVVIYNVTDKVVKIMDPAEGTIKKISLDDFVNDWTGYLVILLPDIYFKQKNLKAPLFSRFYQLICPHLPTLFQAFIGAVVYTLIGLFSSIYIQKITDHVLPENNTNLLNLLGHIGILLLLFQLIIGILKSVLVLRIGQSIDSRLILEYYKHLLTLPQTFFDAMRVGEIISRVNDAIKIRTFINDVALNIVVNFLIVFFSFGLMFTYYWKLGLIMFLSIPIYGVLYFVANKVNKRIQRTLMEDSASMEAQLVESISMVATIKSFGAEYYTNIRTEHTFYKLLRTVYTATKYSINSGGVHEFVAKLFTIILLWCGGYYVIRREISPGELMSFYALIGYFTGPAGQLINSNKTIQEALIAADRLFEIMDLEREENKNIIELTEDLLQDIKFHQVSFRYGSRAQIFKNLNLEIPKGKITGIVGDSGSGKTSLIALLQNLYPIQEGYITIGEIDIRHIRNDSLRNRVVIV